MGAAHARDQIYKSFEKMVLSNSTLEERLKAGVWHLAFVVNHDHDAQSLGEQEWVALNDSLTAANEALRSQAGCDQLESVARDCILSLLAAYRSIPSGDPPMIAPV